MKPVHCICFASALGLILAALPMPNSLSAQSAREREIRSALLGLQYELVEPLLDVTPALLRLQQELVETLRVKLEGVQEQARAGQRTVDDIGTAVQIYYREQETLRVMTARLNDKSISEKDLLVIRIAVRSDALAKFQDESRLAQDRFQVGEVTRTDVVGARARVLKAQIMLEALRQAAGK